MAVPVLSAVMMLILAAGALSKRVSTGEAAGKAHAAHSCHVHKDVVLRWRKPSAKLSSIVVSINELPYAKIGGNRRQISIRKSKLVNVVEVSVEGRVAGTKSKWLSASRFYSSCHKPETTALTLKPAK